VKNRKSQKEKSIGVFIKKIRENDALENRKDKIFNNNIIQNFYILFCIYFSRDHLRIGIKDYKKKHEVI
jgi:hypothetical protein